MRALLSLLLATQVGAGTIQISSSAQWREWSFPAGVIDVDDRGHVTTRQFSRNINAVADAAQFTYKNATGEMVRGGIRKAGSNPGQAALILDGDPATWWKPNPQDALSKWQVDIDLGRLVQVRNIRLMFPDEEGARPFEQYGVFICEGARQVVGKDIFQFKRVGGTTRPTRERFVEIDLQTIEPGEAIGDYLVTTIDDTLDYAPVQYVRVTAFAKNHDGALADIEVVALGDNLGLGTFARGGSIRAGQDVQNVFAVADGSANKQWNLSANRPVDWREGGSWLEWDLGATFWLDQLTMLEFPQNFATTGYANTQQYYFRWQTSDGTPVPTLGEKTPQSAFDYDPLSIVDNTSTQRNLEYNFRFPFRRVRYLFYNHDGFAVDRGFVFRIFQIFLYGHGYPAEAVMQSNFISLQGAKSLRRLQWDADLPPDTRLELRSRTGDTLEEVSYYFDKNGNEIPETRWNKLPNSQKQPIVTASQISSDWSAWSPRYGVNGSEFLSPSPRNFVQIEARLISDNPQVAPTLRSVALDFDDPLVSGGIFGRVEPREAALDSLTLFHYWLRGMARPLDPGFDLIGLSLPTDLAGQVELFVGGQRIDPLRVVQAENELEIALPTKVRSDSVEVVLPLRLVRDAAVFVGWIGSSERPEVRQEVQPEHQGSFVVFVPDIVRDTGLIRKMRLSTTVITPNDDGVNDWLDIEILIVKTSHIPAVAIYDLSGRRVSGAAREMEGLYRWDGRDASGESVSPGLYIVETRVEADFGTERRQRIAHVVY